MTSRRRVGFTIIEVMLFLGIGGLLVMGILVGAGTSLSRQRYKDSVATFQSDIQQLFEDAVAVQNGRQDSGDASCTGSAGASQCVILGGLMVINGSTIQRYRVIGDDLRSDSSSDDLTALRARNPRVSQQDMSTSEIRWGATAYTPGGSTTQLNILVLRSPRSGATFTFTRQQAIGVTASGAVRNLIPASGSTNMDSRTICVNPSGWTTTERLAVVIGPSANSASAIDVKSNEMLQQDGATQC